MADDANSIRLSFYADTSQVAKAGQAVDGLHTQVRRLDTAMVQGARSSRNWGMVAFQAGQAVQDMSYGFHGAINNISFIASMMGAGGAFGIGLQVGLTGVLLLTQNWEKLTRAFQGSNEIPKLGDDFKQLGDEISKVSQRLEELKKHGSLTDSELKEWKSLASILEMKQADAQAETAYRGVAKMRTPEQDSVAGAVAAALKQVGGADALMRQAEANNGGPLDETTRQAWRNSILAALGGNRGIAEFIAETLGLPRFKESLRRELEAVDGWDEEIARDLAESERRLAKRKADQEKKHAEEVAKNLEWMAEQANNQVADKVRRDAINAGTVDRNRMLSDRADARMAPLVEAAGGAGMLAQAANELLAARGVPGQDGPTGRLTARRKRSRILELMRTGMSREDATSAVEADEQEAVGRATANREAAMKNSQAAALSTAKQQMIQGLIARGATPEFARQFADQASRAVLNNTGTESEIKNTEATVALTTEVQKLRQDGIPLVLRRRGG
jgi:hypothetical protein